MSDISMTSKYSDCYFCGGEIEERKIDREVWWQDDLYVIKDVPVGVCRQCGQKVILPGVAKQIDQILAGAGAPDEIMRVPSYRFQQDTTVA